MPKPTVAAMIDLELDTMLVGGDCRSCLGLFGRIKRQFFSAW